jgi:hypothetical protein
VFLLLLLFERECQGQIESIQLYIRKLKSKYTVQPQTLLNVADNSGARKLMCIQIIGVASNQQYAGIGIF